MPPIVVMLPLIVLLTAAAVIDLRTRKIPNWLTVLVALSGLTQAVVWQNSIVNWWQALLGLAVGLLINIPLFLLHIRGGGDVKLFAGLGAWLGPINIIAVFIAATIVAMFVAVIQAIATGRTRQVAHNVAHMSVAAVHGDGPGDSPSNSARHIPYAVPMLLSVLALLLWR